MKLRDVPVFLRAIVCIAKILVGRWFVLRDESDAVVSRIAKLHPSESRHTEIHELIDQARFEVRRRGL